MQAAAVCKGNGEILARVSHPTPVKDGPEVGLERIAQMVQQVLDGTGRPLTRLAGIGVGCTGPLDTERGLIMEPWTMPGWDEVPIVEVLAARFDRPVTLDNDANVAALGEHWLGAGRGCAHMVYVTVSTGIGSGVIVDNRLLHGSGSNFGEVGLMTIDMHGPPCFEGSSGAWEHLASGSAIARIARERADLPMIAAAGGDPEAITAALVARLAKEGHAIARAIMAQEAQYLGVGLANLMVLYAPQVIIMGGGVMESWDLLHPAIEQIAHARTRLIPTAQRTPVVRTQLRLAAGFIGAARMAFLAVE
jgi:glucokinase